MGVSAVVAELHVRDAAEIGSSFSEHGSKFRPEYRRLYVNHGLP